MSFIWTPSGIFRRVEYASEQALEDAIAVVQNELFGQDRIYLNVKKVIGGKGQIRNIPDGYLIDLSGRKVKSSIGLLPFLKVSLRICQRHLQFKEGISIQTILTPSSSQHGKKASSVYLSESTDSLQSEYTAQ